MGYALSHLLDLAAQPHPRRAANGRAQDFRRPALPERRSWLPGFLRRPFSAGRVVRAVGCDQRTSFRGLLDAPLSMPPSGPRMFSLTSALDALQVAGEGASTRRAHEALARTTAAVRDGQSITDRRRSQGDLRPT